MFRKKSRKKNTPQSTVGASVSGTALKQNSFSTSGFSVNYKPIIFRFIFMTKYFFKALCNLFFKVFLSEHEGLLLKTYYCRFKVKKNRFSHDEILIDVTE